MKHPDTLAYAFGLQYSIILYVMNGKQNNKGIRHDDSTNTDNEAKNWQDFEKLCKLLWGEIWNCSDSIKQHGRQGQAQHGVDIYAYVEKYAGYCGIQCKGKDDYTNAQLTEVEIDNEIDKAKHSLQNLKDLFLQLRQIRMQL